MANHGLIEVIVRSIFSFPFWHFQIIPLFFFSKMLNICRFFPIIHGGPSQAHTRNMVRDFVMFHFGLPLATPCGQVPWDPYFSLPIVVGFLQADSLFMRLF